MWRSPRGDFAKTGDAVDAFNSILGYEKKGKRVTSIPFSGLERILIIYSTK
jgi:hypothetical protein